MSVNRCYLRFCKWSVNEVLSFLHSPRFEFLNILSYNSGGNDVGAL